MYEIPFPTSPVPPDLLDRAAFKRWSHTLNTVAALHLSVVLPTSMVPIDVATSAPGSIPTEVALFRSTDGPAWEVGVYACLVEREVEPADWMALVWEARGERVVAGRSAEGRGGTSRDALTVSGEGADVVTSRWLVTKNGRYLVWLQARCELRHYPGLADDMCMAVSSLNLLHPEPWPLAERLGTFTAAVPEGFLLFYPASWNIQLDNSVDEGASGGEIYHQQNGIKVGRILWLFQPTGPEQVEASTLLLGAVQRAGIDLPAILPPVRDDSSEPRTVTLSLDPTAGRAALELRVASAERAQCTWAVVMLGPPREHIPEAWMLNARAFALVTRHLRFAPPPDAPAAVVLP